MSREVPEKKRSFVLYYLLGVVLVVAVLQLVFAPGPHPLEGEAAPAWQAPLLGGGELDLADHLGADFVVLDFWATWCPPCRESLPEYARIAQDYAGRGVAVYAVNFMEPAELVQAFLRQQEVEIAVPLDVYGTIARDYEISNFPSSLIIDRDGTIDTVYVGYSAQMMQELRERLDTLLAGQVQD